MRLDVGAALAVAVACAAVAAIILRFRSGDWYGLFASIEVLLLGLAIAGPWSAVPLSDPWSGLTRGTQKLAEAAILMQLYVFPNGRFKPRWTLVTLAIFIGWAALGIVLPSVDPIVARGAWQVALLAVYISGLAVLGYRFARFSSTTERRQTKWLIYGATLTVAAYALWSYLRFGAGNLALATGADIFVQLTTVILAIAYGIGILRFRLYDIDLVINRTVLYASATGALLVAIAGISQVSQLLIQVATGRSSEILTIPLIVTAALAFQPLQHRLRPLVDRLLPPRAVLTLFFTDIGDSTGRAVSMGDERWRETLSIYRATVRKGLRRFRGSEMDTAGDGFFAVFDRPMDALHLAQWARHALWELDLDSRFGLHAGECQVRGEKVSGVAVITAARVMATARPNEIVVTAAVRDALGGDADALLDLGSHPLKGLPGEWRLFSVPPAANAAR